MKDNELEFNILRFKLGILHTDELSRYDVDVKYSNNEFILEYLESMSLDTQYYYIFYPKEVDYEKNRVVLDIKKDYTDFSSLELVNTSRIYRSLYAITINPDIKRLIMFLYLVPNDDLSYYMSLLPDSIVSQLLEFIELSSNSKYHLKY